MERKMEPQSAKIQRTISLGELVMVLVVLTGSILAFWKTIDIRVTVVESKEQAFEKSQERLIQKLDEVQESINEIKISMKDKQDRK